MSSSALVEYPASLRYALTHSGTQYPYVVSMLMLASFNQSEKNGPIIPHRHMPACPCASLARGIKRRR